MCAILQYILVKIFHFISLVFYIPIINTPYLPPPPDIIIYFGSQSRCYHSRLCKSQWPSCFPLMGKMVQTPRGLESTSPLPSSPPSRLCPLRQAPRPPWTLGTAAHGPTQPQVSTPLPSHAKAHPDGCPPREPAVALVHLPLGSAS